MLTLTLSAWILAAPPAVELTWQNYESIRDHVLPREHEDRWLDIPWRGTFWDGLEEATERDLPLLLWAMNGHPLGCV